MGGFKNYIQNIEKKLAPPPKHEWPFIGSSHRQKTIAYSIGRVLVSGRGLASAFSWAVTPQGHRYWSQRNLHGLDDEAINILEAWLENYRGQL